MRVALFEPDIPQNTGTILRLAACMDVAVDIIEPCGFVFQHKNFRRAGMDYIDHVDLKIHDAWQDFLKYHNLLSEKSGVNKKTDNPRLVLLSTKSQIRYCDFAFERDDILLLGRESVGVTEDVRETCHAGIKIPSAASCRSLNVAVATSMVLGEALRQTGAFPDGT